MLSGRVLRPSESREHRGRGRAESRLQREGAAHLPQRTPLDEHHPRARDPEMCAHLRERQHAQRFEVVGQAAFLPWGGRQPQLQT